MILEKDPLPGYQWLLDRGLVGFEPFGPLQPWHYLRPDDQFDVTAHWKKLFEGDSLIAFARRQDCDDLACFRISKGKTVAVCLVHAWTPTGYEVLAEYKSFWEWLKAVVDDIQAWAEPPEQTSQE